MTPFQGMPIISGYADKPKKVQIANRHAKIIIKMFNFLWYNTFCLWNITTKINFSQPGGVNVILQTVRQIDATQNKAVPDDPYARLFKAAPSCYILKHCSLYWVINFTPNSFHIVWQSVHDMWTCRYIFSCR